jgi:predicted transcriptional regulator of viral defense system
METSDLTTPIQKIYQSKLNLFTTKTLRDILGVNMPQITFFTTLARLTRQNVLRKLERDKYILTDSTASSFQIGNFLYTPSYISLFTALNFYGVVSQFPYEISSITTKKPVTKIIDNVAYRYVRIKQSLFWGYELSEGVLIAQPEKALLDALYLMSKGLVVVHIDELDLSNLDKKRFNLYKNKFPAMKGTDIL